MKIRHIPPAPRCCRAMDKYLADEPLRSARSMPPLLLLLLRIIECVRPCRSTCSLDEPPSLFATAADSSRIPYIRFLPSVTSSRKHAATMARKFAAPNYPPERMHTSPPQHHLRDHSPPYTRLLLPCASEDDSPIKLPSLLSLSPRRIPKVVSQRFSLPYQPWLSPSPHRTPLCTLLLVSAGLQKGWLQKYGPYHQAPCENFRAACNRLRFRSFSFFQSMILFQLLTLRSLIRLDRIRFL